MIGNDILCIADEVYEHMVYNPLKHIRIATLEGMAERTLTIGSAGKSLSVTGWKTGWVIGPVELVQPVQRLWVNTMGSGVTPVQTAVGRCFEHEMKISGTRHPAEDPNSFFRRLTEDTLRPKRDRMAHLIESIGLQPIVPEGGYFIIADATDYRDVVGVDNGDQRWDVKCISF